MPTEAAIAAVSTAFGVSATTSAIMITVASAVVSMAANMALNSILAESAPTANPGDYKDSGPRGHLINTRNTQQPLSRNYGRCRVGINQVYLGVS
ncbi:MAG: hypothetical protein Q7I98_07975, partial [Erysipelotrichaceae bacterium]|nr:hypothetical protein [Erysipelotrichaceae bacterium]